MNKLSRFRSILFGLGTCVGWALWFASGPLAAQDTSRNLLLQQVARPVAAQEQRVALVIGNNAYKDAPLTNPVNDARAIADALRASGFAVTLRTDITHRDFLVAVREFGDTLRRGGVGVFYFAGHGMQIKGRNYLVPAGSTIEREDEVAYAAIDAQAVLDKMEAAGNATNLMILDACRNNPFARSFRSSTQGLAQMEAPAGTLVAFATAPGSVASDGQGVNGLYTQHLLQAMRKPGIKVEDVFKQTRAGVRRDSAGKQIPWESTSMEGDFYFVQAVAPPPVPAPPPLDTARAVDEAFWSSVKDSRDGVELRAYLKRFPQGVHAGAARQALQALEVAAARPAVIAAAVPVPPAVAPVVQAPAKAPPAVASAPAPTSVLPVRPVAVATAAATQPKPPVRPAPAPARSNAHGYTVGDKWNYQVIDRWKGEVLRNYALQVHTMDEDGRWATAGGSQFDAAGRLRKAVQAGEWVREFSPTTARWWPGIKVGDQQQHQYEVKHTPVNGGGWTNRVKTESNVVRRETVRVPAGEFDALRIEIKGKSEAVGRPGVGQFSQTVWYSPELHTMVAFEEETFWDGKLDARSRDELTSLRLVHQRDLAAQGLAPAPAPAAAEAGRLAANARRSNAQGFTVGEKWQFQRIDLWKGAVIGTPTFQVDRIDAQGAMVFRNDGDYADPWYHFSRSLLASTAPGQAASDGADVWWAGMKAGDRRKVNLVAKQRRRDGSVVPAEVSVNLLHKGVEKIRVPAGEYDALYLEADGSSEWVGLDNAPAFFRWTMGLWYVPALRAFAATELKSTTTRERLELASFQLRTGPLAAR